MAAVAKSRTSTRTLPVKRSVVRVIVLTVVSLGLYQLYWFYVKRDPLNEELGDQASYRGWSPGAQTFVPVVLGILGIPAIILLGLGLLMILAALILAVVFWYGLLKDLNQARVREGFEPFSPGLYVLGYIVLSFLNLANLAIYGLVVYQLNAYWDKRSKGGAVEAPYTTSEVLVSLAGVILFIGLIVLVVISAIAGESLDSY
jgi:hypothetical protein